MSNCFCCIILDTILKYIFLHIRNLHYYPIVKRSICFYELFHQVIYNQFIMIKIQARKQYHTFIKKSACAFNFCWKLWSGLITSGKLFPLKVRGCEVAITTGGSLCSWRFGALRLLFVWGFTFSSLGEKFQLVEVTAEYFVLVGEFLQETFVLNHLSFLKWEINFQMLQTNYHLMVLMELLRKRKGSQHVQNSFSLILLAAEWPFKYSRPLTLIFFDHQ